MKREIDYGPCCICRERNNTVRNLMMIHKRAPIPGTGWGCVVCDLPSDGAIAVVCDACLTDFHVDQLKDVCSGYVLSNERAPYDQLNPERFDHKPVRHDVEMREAEHWDLPITEEERQRYAH